MKKPSDPTFRISIAIFFMLALMSTPISAYAQTSVDVIVHYVEGSPIAGQFAYDVSVYFSLLDSDGDPITNISTENLTISEDGKRIAIESLQSAEEEPISVALVLDTSGSMAGQKITAARNAATDFISNLKTGDQIGILSFNTTLTHHTDFTTELASARNQVNRIESVPLSGTCLYDAAYEAVQMTATLPSGRRAIILLTDGVDELLQGGLCSTYTVDDVINLATQRNTRVPIYTIGLGSKVDARTLDRLAALTGGKSLYSPESSQLEALFQKLSDLLRSQFVLHYTTTSAPGEHTLVLQASYHNAQDQDSRNYVLPPFPYSISFISPVAGQEISGRTKLTIAITGQGEPIEQVVFQANDVIIGTADMMPYEIEWDPDTAAGLPGVVTLVAIAQGEGNEELARSSVEVTIAVAPPATESPQPTMVVPVTPETDSSLLIGGIGILLVLIGGSVAFIIIRRARSRHEVAPPTDMYPPSGEGRDFETVDMIALGASYSVVLGRLVILQSDDPAIIGQKIDINKPSISLGRSAENDIIFPKDKPVSRRHAIIEDRDGQLTLSEVLTTDSDGNKKRPTYGTFVNDMQIEDPVPLFEGDEIKLGSRVRMRLESVRRSGDIQPPKTDQPPSDEKTMDYIDIREFKNTQ